MSTRRYVAAPDFKGYQHLETCSIKRPLENIPRRLKGVHSDLFLNPCPAE